jgi:hypothetical protein
MKFGPKAQPTPAPDDVAGKWKQRQERWYAGKCSRDAAAATAAAVGAGPAQTSESGPQQQQLLYGIDNIVDVDGLWGAFVEYCPFLLLRNSK